MQKCKCGSTKIVKYGHRHNWKGGKKYRVQMVRCNNCGRQFRER